MFNKKYVSKNIDAIRSFVNAESSEAARWAKLENRSDIDYMSKHRRFQEMVVNSVIGAEFTNKSGQWKPSGWERFPTAGEIAEIRGLVNRFIIEVQDVYVDPVPRADRIINPKNPALTINIPDKISHNDFRDLLLREIGSGFLNADDYGEIYATAVELRKNRKFWIATFVGIAFVVVAGGVVVVCLLKKDTKGDGTCDGGDCDIDDDIITDDLGDDDVIIVPDEDDDDIIE